MNDREDAVRARLASLADELAGDPGAVRPDRLRERHRGQRRARVTVLAVTAAVVVVGVGVPTAAATFSASGPVPGAAAGPGVPTEATTPPTGDPADQARAEARLSAARSAAEPARGTAVSAGRAALDDLYGRYLQVHDCLVAHGYRTATPVGEQPFAASAGGAWNPYDGLPSRDFLAATGACPAPPAG